MAASVNQNDSVVSANNTQSQSTLGTNLRNKAKNGVNGSTTSTNQYSRETPAKKGFFGSVVEQSSNNIGGTPSSKL